MHAGLGLRTFPGPNEADLKEVCLEEADLEEAGLEDADLDEAGLEDAYLEEASVYCVVVDLPSSEEPGSVSSSDSA